MQVLNIFLLDQNESLSRLHKAQLHVSTNFQNINLLQFSETMAVSVSFFTIEKHLIVIRTATNGDLKSPSKKSFICYK